MTKRIIVTGGAGFIGSNLVAALNKRGHEAILVVDHLGTTSKWKNLIGLTFEDYMDKSAFRQSLDSNSFGPVSTVFHLGACSSTTEQNADYLADNNYHYTKHLCEWCLREKIRFVYASSAATYGDGSRGYSDQESHLRSLNPLNMYGFSKHMFDLWAAQHKIFDRIAGLKYFNVYGPREDHKGDMRSVVHKAFGQVQKTGKVKLFKSYRQEYQDGEQVRDFVYVNDAVEQTLFFHDHPEISGLFNCGTGRMRTWNDLVNAVFCAAGKVPNIEYVDMPLVIRAKYQYETRADTEKLRQAGYSKPFTELEAGITDYVTNYLIHLDPSELEN